MKTQPTKKYSFTGYDLIFVITLSFLAVHTLLLLLSACNVITYVVNASHLTAFIYVAISLLILFLCLLFSKKTNIKVSKFFAWVHLLAVIFFLNICVSFGLYSYLIFQILLSMYLAFLFSNFGISIYFASMQDKGTLYIKNYTWAIILIFALSFMFVGFIASIASIFVLCNVISFTVVAVQIISMFVTLLLQMLAFYLSLCKTKKYVNACLIKP